jgi:hypothetical protein
MAYNLWFGKYRGSSLEQVALGMKCPQGGGKSEGYFYFAQLMRQPPEGERNYFEAFQRTPNAVKRWHEIHRKLSTFVAAHPCAICKKDPEIAPPVMLTVVGSRGEGFSAGPGYIACADPDCQESLMAQNQRAIAYDLGFPAILEFGWKARRMKEDEEMLTKAMREIAGWPDNKPITAESATLFIDNLKTR